MVAANPLLQQTNTDDQAELPKRQATATDQYDDEDTKS